MAGINQGPPAQQASALSITQLHLGKLEIIFGQNSTKTMRLHQLKMVQLVLDDSLPRICQLENGFNKKKQDLFHLGLVLPSNIVLSSGGA